MGPFYLGVLVISIMIVLGARLLYVLHEPEQFSSLAEVFYPSSKGFSVTGGLALGIIVSHPLLSNLGLRTLHFWDIVAAPLAFGLAMGRVGCFFAGCCFGKVTHSCLGVLFPWGSQPHLWQIQEGIVGFFQAPQPIYPTQLFEMTALLIIGVQAIRMRLLAHYVEGSAAIFSLLLYSSFRFLNLFFRADPYGSLPAWVHPLLYIITIAACIKWIYSKNKLLNL